MRVFELVEVAAEFDLQGWASGGKGKLLQLSRHSLQDRQAPAPFFRGELRPRLVIRALDQLSRGRNADTAKNSFGLADVNLFGRKKNVCPKVAQLRFLDLPFSGGQRESDLSVANIQRIEERLVMNQGGVIDVERDFAHPRQRILAVLVIENPHVLGHQSAKWVER